MTKILFEARDIHKSFPGVKALAGVEFFLREGEIVALVGTNGAGKSTLCNIIAGIYPCDEGETIIDGKSVKLTSPKTASANGIGIVHQEPTLVPQLSVMQNLFLGREKLKNGQRLDFKLMEKESLELLDSLGFKIDVRRKASTLTLVEQQIVGIANAMLLDPKILILDEVTASLNLEEVKYLFSLIRDLKKRGIGIIFINHKIKEVLMIADRVVVFRDGLNAADLEVTPELDERDIIAPMLGEILDSDFYDDAAGQAKEDASQEALMRVKNLEKTGALYGVSFEIKKGEIIGFAGLKGAGVTELFSSLSGGMQFDSGEVYLGDTQVVFKTPADALKQGIGMITNERQKENLAIPLDIRANITISSLFKMKQNKRLLDLKKINDSASEYVSKLDIVTPSIKQLVINLSGGNQQKVIIAKMLLRDLHILFIDEPTRGVDVGAKAEIYKLLINQKKEGRSILIYSPETRELLDVCDRIYLVSEGLIVEEIERGTDVFNEPHILEVLHSG